MSFPTFPIDGQTSVVNNITYVYSLANNTWIRLYASSATISSLFINGTGTSTSTTTGALVVAGGVGIGGNLYANLIYSNGVPVGPSSFVGGVIVNATQITTGTVSISTTTGALVVTGGVGIGGDVNIGGNLYLNGALAVTTATIGQFASTTGTNSQFNVTNTTQSTSTVTGAITVAGGVGIRLNLNVGGTITGGTITGGGVRTTTTSTPPSNPTVGDIWYNSSTDVMYRWTFDGTSSYWIDEYTSITVGATVTSNKTVAFSILFGG